MGDIDKLAGVTSVGSDPPPKVPQLRRLGGALGREPNRPSLARDEPRAKLSDLVGAREAVEIEVELA